MKKKHLLPVALLMSGFAMANATQVQAESEIKNIEYQEFDLQNQEPAVNPVEMTSEADATVYTTESVEVDNEVTLWEAEEDEASVSEEDDTTEDLTDLELIEREFSWYLESDEEIDIDEFIRQNGVYTRDDAAIANNSSDVSIQQRDYGAALYRGNTQLFDELVEIGGKRYFAQASDRQGILAKNGWFRSQRHQSWFYANDTGEIVSDLNNSGYTIYGEKQYDTVIELPESKYYYVASREENGELVRNRWAYSNREQKWHYGGDDGVIASTLSPEGYWIHGKQYADTIVEIPKYGYYFFKGWDEGGKMARGEWAFSPNERKWHYANGVGLVTSTVGHEGYWIHGQKQYDQVVEIPGVAYFYAQDRAHNGHIVRDNWAYSKKENKWHYGNHDGVLVSTLGPEGFWELGQKMYDTPVEIVGHGYYYVKDAANGGKMARNEWVYSNREKTWHKTDRTGYIIETFSDKGYWVRGVQRFDTVLNHNGNRYFFQSASSNGLMLKNNWAKSVRDNIWYKTNSAGHIIDSDAVGPELPSYVNLDRGQWRVFAQWEDGWETGCWTRAAASGILSAGGSSTPQQVYHAIPKTNDPRTGRLSEPWIVNNWNFGGAYSQAWPSALLPYIRQQVPNAADITGASANDIKRELAAGNTVQVFYAWVKPNIRLNAGNGLGDFYASKDYHSVLLTGYDANGFYYQDHYQTARNNHMPNWKFNSQFENFGRMAIAFRK